MRGCAARRAENARFGARSNPEVSHARGRGDEHAGGGGADADVLRAHGLVEQPIVNRILVEMARSMDLPVVATNDAHYLRRDDAGAQRALT